MESIFAGIWLPTKVLKYVLLLVLVVEVLFDLMMVPKFMHSQVITPLL